MSIWKGQGRRDLRGIVSVEEQSLYDYSQTQQAEESREVYSFKNGFLPGRIPCSTVSTAERAVRPIKAVSESPPFPLFQPPQLDGPPPEMELADPDFYKIGFVRSFRAYGVEFREGPDGFGVFASKDVEPLRRARHSSLPSSFGLGLSKTGCPIQFRGTGTGPICCWVQESGTSSGPG
ncbi:hypothetical protein Cgig2_023559 [Carnegiea gigantea]|uniref:Uncharacterized protein n=1 Tax=Carnegiea gigantea TaxID=171969 RepID=A0A9Q1QA94_9CARY|nr:hypothetical protein Cgig2_023559 [Carnegiea gigantea]